MRAGVGMVYYAHRHTHTHYTHRHAYMCDGLCVVPTSHPEDCSLAGAALFKGASVSKHTGIADEGMRLPHQSCHLILGHFSDSFGGALCS